MLQQAQRVDVLRIVFDAARVVRWQPALLPGQVPLALRDGTFYYYGMNAGLGTIMDSVANQQFARLSQVTWNRVVIDAAARPSYAGLYQFRSHNLATSPIGLGDGCHPTYLGFGARGQVCRLLTDFGMLNW